MRDKEIYSFKQKIELFFTKIQIDIIIYFLFKSGFRVIKSPS
jgi:hypothetical protein